MNPLALESETVTITAHERNAVRKRLAQIEVMLGHPKLTARQADAIIQERDMLARALGDDSEE